MKTIKELNEKIYYRLFKSIYIVCSIIIIFIMAFESEGSIIYTPIISLIFFEIIRRAIFYTIFGTLFPKK